MSNGGLISKLWSLERGRYVEEYDGRRLGCLPRQGLLRRLTCLRRQGTASPVLGRADWAPDWALLFQLGCSVSSARSIDGANTGATYDVRLIAI
jgi:hypothetical protein